MVNPYITPVTLVIAENLLKASPACLPNSVISLLANLSCLALLAEACANLVEAETELLSTWGKLEVLIDPIAVPRLRIARAAEFAFPVVVSRVLLKVNKAAFNLFILVVAAGATVKLTEALILPSCFLISDTITETLVGPLRLSCAVRLKPDAIFYQVL